MAQMSRICLSVILIFLLTARALRITHEHNSPLTLTSKTSTTGTVCSSRTTVISTTLPPNTKHTATPTCQLSPAINTDVPWVDALDAEKAVYGNPVYQEQVAFKGPKGVPAKSIPTLEGERVLLWLVFEHLYEPVFSWDDVHGEEDESLNEFPDFVDDGDGERLVELIELLKCRESRECSWLLLELLLSRPEFPRSRGRSESEEEYRQRGETFWTKHGKKRLRMEMPSREHMIARWVFWEDVKQLQLDMLRDMTTNKGKDWWDVRSDGSEWVDFEEDEWDVKGWHAKVFKSRLRKVLALYQR
ncbi:hypothetical protein B0J14DRAFT_607174 [Halenospora varia]|nr:hypothetical protein B0J14DRAFT_607174 [Halenospora varia]